MERCDLSGRANTCQVRIAQGNWQGSDPERNEVCNRACRCAELLLPCAFDMSCLRSTPCRFTWCSAPGAADAAPAAAAARGAATTPCVQAQTLGESSPRPASDGERKGCCPCASVFHYRLAQILHCGHAFLAVIVRWLGVGQPKAGWAPSAVRAATTHGAVPRRASAGAVLRLGVCDPGVSSLGRQGQRKSRTVPDPGA